MPDDVKQEISQWVELRGIVPRSQIVEEFRWADVFLLPSLCEGSATAVYEALAAGLPVITTENTGSVVRDGVEGFIVPVCDPEAIATAVRALADNPELRRSMSTNALLRAAEHTVESYGERLLPPCPGRICPGRRVFAWPMTRDTWGTKRNEDHPRHRFD